MKNPTSHSRVALAKNLRSSRGFTLVELLVVIAIIAALAAISIVGTKRIREGAKMARSTANLRQIHIYAGLYSADNSNKIVPSKAADGQQWQITLARYSLPDLTGIWDFTTPKGYKDEISTFIAPGWTDSPYYDKNRYWQTGYGLNTEPGRPTTSDANTAEGGFGRLFNQSDITAPSLRAYVLTWPEWNARYSKSNEGKSALISGKINVLFFDGHVEAIAPSAAEKVFNIPAERNM